MAKTRRAYTGGAASTTTSSNILSSGTTSFTITAYTGWPYGSDPFFVVVEPGTANEEKILVTRTGSTDTTINVYATPSVAANRGADGTSSVAHSSGVTVFPVFTALDADEANELTSAFGSKGDLVSYGSSTFETLGVGSDDAVLIADSGEASGLKWGSVDTAQLADDAVTGAKLAQGYTYHSTVYFTSSGSFTKASYPWLRAVRVKCQGAGSGGANRNVGNTSSPGGGGGAMAESFITDIASLASSETVTVGAGSAGVASGVQGDSSAGGDSSFGTLVIGVGASGTSGLATYGGRGGQSSACTGDFAASGNDGETGNLTDDGRGGNGGGSHFGGGGRGGRLNTTNGLDGNDYGGGGGGGTETAAAGDGADGIVIVELFA